ncbi:MAG: M48 family metalloprotease [Cytophagales bacterium]|nr:M48 family metalloprotease [Cytophagales bacterium]
MTGRKQFVMMSEQQEIRQWAEHPISQIMAFFGSYDDPALQKFISDKGQEMVRISDRPKITYQFAIVDSPVVNAFATPGYVYFTRGILANFNNEAELPET